MKRKEMEKVIRVEELKRKMRLARHNKKYIRFLYYKFILFLINLFDDINRVINGFNYKGEYEKQNVQLDNQKKRINDLEKQVDDLADMLTSREEDIAKLESEIASRDTTIRNLKKRIREIKKK